MRVRALVAGLVAAAFALAGCSSGPPPAEPVTPAPVTVTPAPQVQRTTPPEPEVPQDPLPEGAVNVLVIGSDSGDPVDMLGNADTIMLVQLSADRESVALVSLTRDMWVPIPGRGEAKINAAYAYGGPELLMATVSDLLGGVEIHYSVTTAFAGFLAVVDALGGFEVDNRYASSTVLHTGEPVSFAEGRIHLEGAAALAYVRQRSGLPLGDLDRTQRGRAAMVGIADAVRARAGDPVAALALARAVHEHVAVKGDLDVADVVSLVPLLQELRPDDVTSLMAPITGFGTRGGASVNVVDDVRMAALGDALRAGSVEEYVDTYGLGYAP